MVVLGLWCLHTSHFTLNTNLLYTCLFGEGDTLKQPVTITPGWDYLVFTDQEISDPGVWRVITPHELVSVNGSKRLSRYFKVFPYLQGYDTAVYIDATYRPVGDLDAFVKDMGDGVHMTKHPQRSCVYDEFKVVRSKGLDTQAVLDAQEQRYRAQGYPENNGLFRCGVIVRKGDTRNFDSAWWDEVSGGSWRDQLCAPVASHVSGVPITPIPHGLVETHFRHHLHNPRKISNTLFYNPSPISAVPKDAWVYVGKDSEDEVREAIGAYPLVHAIRCREGVCFQRWVYDYISYVDRMLEIVKLYRGTYAIYL